MHKPLPYLGLFLLILASTGIAFFIEHHVFIALIPHWAAIEALFETESVVRRNYTENIPVLLGALFALGTPILVSALSGYALYRIEHRSGTKHFSETFMRRALAVTLTIVFLGGIIVIVNRGLNISLQLFGGAVILFGIISLFTVAWAQRFFGKMYDKSTGT